MVSVVIPNFNGRKFLAECLDSLKAQSYKEFEIIVVDNGSSDGSAGFIKKNYPGIKVVELSQNKGFAGGVNAGIQASSGKMVALLNNDAVADENWLRELVASLDAADIAASKILHYDNSELIDSTGEFISRWGIAYPRGRNEIDLGQYDTQTEIFAASGGASIFKKAVIEDIGGFDERFFAYLEDVDLSFRARLRGYRVIFAPKAKIYHRIGGTSSNFGSFTRYHFIKNSAFLYFKNFPLPLLFAGLPRFIVIETLLILAALKAGALGAVIKSQAAFWYHLPGILISRSKIQSGRKVSATEIEGQLTNHWPLKRRLWKKN